MMTCGYVLLIVAACSVFALSQGQDQASLANLAKTLKVTWTVITNTREDYNHQVEITLENTARDLNLTYGPWQIHFSCAYRIEPDLIGNLGNKEVELTGQNVTVTQLQGDQYYLKPTQGFISLTPGDRRKIQLKIGYYSVARTDTLPNWYIILPNLQPEVIDSTKGNLLEFVTARTTVQQWKRFGADEYNPWTVQDRYERNYVADSSYSSEIRVIPKPVSVVIADPDDVVMVVIDNSWSVTSSAELTNQATYLKSKLGIPSSISSISNNVIQLSLGEVNVTAANETFGKSPDAYILTVNATSRRIEVVGQGASGVFYGVITLLSLLDVNGQVPECIITDTPRFPYRGLMLDIARNFHPKEDILNIIKLMSSYKLNQLHLHLSDDEGWRINIPQLPELTTFGSQRCYDPTETTCLMPQLGSGPTQTGSPGSGFLTSADYIEILQLANAYHVTVIPEIEMPGHGRAAILSMKLRNNTLGDVGASTVLAEADDPSEYTTPQMYSDNAINPCLNSTYNFVDIIMNEFISLHRQGQQPLKIFHFGGDEVGRGAWVNSSHCQKLIASNTVPGGSLKWLFFEKVAELAANKNLSLAAWEDGLVDNEDKPFNLSTSPVKEVLAYSWNNVWEPGTVSRTYKFAEEGYKVILAHATYLYFDHPDEPDPEERGPYWATRFTDIQKVFFYNAENYYDNIPTQESGAPVPADELCGQANKSCPQLTNPENIFGMVGALFCETVRTTDEMYHRLFPRLLALADRAWHKASWESLPKGDERDKQQKADWFSFARAVGYRELPKLDQQNVTYRIPPPGAILSYGRLLTTPLYPGLVVEYSLDAGNTWQNAQPFVSLGDYKYRIWLRTRTPDAHRFSRTVVFDPVPQIKITNQPIIDYISEHLRVQYTVVDNYKKYGTNLYEASIQLSNGGDKAIPGGNWRIYFVAVNVIEPAYLLNGHEYVDPVANITISHTNGYLYSLGPSAKFIGLKPGDSLKFNFRVQFWSVSRYEQMPRWYVSSPGMNAKNLKSTAGEDLAFVSPFTKPESWKRFDFDKFDPWTPGVRYNRNAAWEVAPLASYPVIPTPFSFTSSKQMVSLLKDPWTVVYDTEAMRSVGKVFKELMEEFFPGVTNISLSQTTPAQRYIRFVVGNVKQGTNFTEAYSVQVQAGSKVVNVSGASPDGVFYGAVTLIQMALKSSPAGSLPESQVEDWPRFTYRGMHVDTARNFIPKTSILKLLRVMSLYKLNKLHFHLSDDEGWRLEIPGLEELTKVGGRRCHDLEERQCVMSTLGSGADDNSSGSGFYTVKDYQEILQLANKLHIEVIPEFDMPGHAHSAIRAMKVRQLNLQNKGNKINSGDYVLHDAADTSHYFSVQYYTDNAVNPCIESTYMFISEVYKQVTEIHKSIQPLKVYHFGGDEVAPGAWVDSTACARFLRSGVSLKRLFTQRVAKITQNVSLGAWEDGLMDHDSTPWQRSLLANKEIIVNAWQNVWEWGVASRAYNLANAGYKVVFSPVTHMYLDHPQEPNPEERGFYWGTRYTDAFKTFSFMPDHYYLNADIKRSGEPITMEEICGENNVGCPPLTKPENILGLQGQLWSETIRSPEQLEYMIFPRLLALAERAWHKGAWEGMAVNARSAPLKSDWARFASSLGSKDLGILDKMGIAYRVPPPGAKQDVDKVSAKVEFPGLKVQYKIQNSTWSILQQTTTFKVGQEVTLRTLSADQKRYSTEVKVVMVKIPTGEVKNKGGNGAQKEAELGEQLLMMNKSLTDLTSLLTQLLCYEDTEIQDLALKCLSLLVQLFGGDSRDIMTSEHMECYCKALKVSEPRKQKVLLRIIKRLLNTDSRHLNSKKKIRK